MLDSSITSNRKKTVDAESKPEIGAINVDTACGAVYHVWWIKKSEFGWSCE